MNIFLFSIGLGVYSVQLAQGLGVKDRVVIALTETELHNLEVEHPIFFNNALFETVSIHHFKFPNPRKFIQVWQTFRKIVQHKPDVIHVLLTGSDPESFLTLWLASKIGIPIVATVHDTRFHPGDFARLHTIWLHFKILELCSQIIVHGKYMAQDLIHWLGIDKRIINTVPHGNYDIYLQIPGNPLDVDPNPAQVLLFGRMKKYKGIETLINAAPVIAEKVPNLKIILAGQGKDLDRLESKLKSIPFFEIRNRYIPAKEVAALFSSSALIVLPYIEASQSGPLHLAYTLGRPLVATRVGAIPESLCNGKEGFLVAPNDPLALAKAIIKILTNRNLAVKMGQAAKIKAEKKLGWANGISNKTRAVYKKAIEMKKRNLFYPGIGAQARWKRVKNYYFRVLKDEYGR